MKRITELSPGSSITEITRQLSAYEVVEVLYESFDPNYFATLVEQLPDYTDQFKYLADWLRTTIRMPGKPLIRWKEQVF